jgi:O-antigen ligase
MDGLFLKQATTATKISYYHILFFMASLPFDMFYSHVILISFCLHTIIQSKGPVRFLPWGRGRKGFSTPEEPLPANTLSSRTPPEGGNYNVNRSSFIWHNILLQSVFWITALSTIYTLNRPEAFSQLGRHIPILLFPVLFGLSPFDFRRYRPQLLLGFSLVCTAIVGYLYLDALYTIRFYGLPLKAILSSSFTNHNFSDPIGIHATFFSLQLAISLVCLLSILLKEPDRKRQLFYAICVCMLSAGLMQLSSKAVFFAVFLVVNIAVPVFLLQGNVRRKFIWITGSISVLIIGAILTLGFLKTRYISNFKYDMELTSKNALLDSRLDRWSTSFELIKQKPIIGYGAGSELALLHESFYAKKYYSSFINHLNTHNEYLSFWLKSGIIGLLAYLVTLGFGFKQALKRKDLLFFTFMLLVAFVSFSENLLDVDKGVIFYAFFFSFFVFSGDEKQTISY